ncbi:hypothetical protein GCM10029992_47310 [Glycomyces albus]
MSTGTFELAGLDGGRVGLTSSQLERLGSRLDGRLLTAGDDGWDESVLLWNALAAHKPALVVRPASTGDVAEAVRFASAHGILTSVKEAGTTSPGPPAPRAG